MFISTDKEGNITGKSSYKFYDSCIELPDEDIKDKVYDFKTKKLIPNKSKNLSEKTLKK